MTARTVLVVSQLPPPVNGSTMMTRHLVAALEQRDRRVVVVQRRFSRSVDEIGRFAFRKVFAGVGLWWRLAIALLADRPDVCVLFLTNRVPSLYVDATLIPLLRLTRTPYVVYCHTSGYGALERRLDRAAVGAAVRYARATVALAPALATELELATGQAPGSVAVIRNTTVPPTAEAMPRDAPPLLAFYSNLLPEKGFDHFLDLLTALGARGVRFQAEAAGHAADGTRDAIDAEIERRGLSGVLAYRGPLAESEKWTFLRRASLLAFPSRYRFEAQPLSLIEAKAVGTPAVAFAIGGVPDLLGPDRGGIAVPVGDTARLLDECARLLGDPAARAALATEAREDFLRRFAPAKFGDAWQQVLDDATPGVHESPQRATRAPKKRDERDAGGREGAADPAEARTGRRRRVAI